jgi:archaemetzincin
MPALDLVPILLGDGKALLRRLVKGLEEGLGLDVRIRDPDFDPDAARDTGRAQYNSSVLLARLLQMARPDSRILGVAGVDLFIPILTYVFGEAQVGGPAAVVSLHRLRPELYGLPPDPRLTEQRLLIETLHEMGHTFGLLHCLEPGCVMGSSTYVEQIDLKTHEFCSACGAGIPSAGDRMPPPARP